MTLGRHTVPVYEIYKVGEDVRLLDGLNVLGDIGVNAVVIPTSTTPKAEPRHAVLLPR